jgi:MoxR-like ATPase
MPPSPKDRYYSIFKTRHNEFVIMVLSDYKVSLSYSLTHDASSGKFSCTCPLGRVGRSECEHVQILKTPFREKLISTEVFLDLETPINWTDASVPVMQCVGLHFPLKDNPKYALLSPEVGPLDVEQFNHLLKFGSTRAIEDAPKNGELCLDVNYLFDRLTSAYQKRATVTSVEILSGASPGFIQKKSLSPWLKEIFNLDESVPAQASAPNLSGSSAPAVHAPVLPWKTAKLPAITEFYVLESNWRQILYCLAEGGNVLLTGPAGQGKSELAYIAARTLGLTLEAFNFGAMSEPRASLIGNTHFNKEKGTWFAESRFVRTVQQANGCALLDEINRAGPAAYNILLPLLDRQGYLALDESETSPIIKKGERATFIATANLGSEYSGTEALDVALEDRFDVVIDVEFPPKEPEMKILMGRYPQLKTAVASKLVDFANDQRTMKLQGDFTRHVSTRMLLAVAKQIVNGISIKDALKFCVANHFSNDGAEASDRSKIFQLIQKKNP